MFTVFTIEGVPEHIYFTNTDDLDKVIRNRDIDPSFVRSQELSIERLIRLKDREYTLFILCLK